VRACRLPLAEMLIGFHLLIPFHLQCDDSFMHTLYANGIVAANARFDRIGQGDHGRADCSPADGSQMSISTAGLHSLHLSLQSCPGKQEKVELEMKRLAIPICGCRCLLQLMLHDTNVQLPSPNDFYTSIVVNLLS